MDLAQRRTPIQDVRRLHRALVLQTLRDEGPQPRADLARRLGLSATTMTKVVGQLLSEGVVAEGDHEGPGLRVGRPSTHIRIAPLSRFVLGVQVGAGNVQLGLCDLLARVHHQSSFTFDLATTDPTEVVARIATAASTLLASTGTSRTHLLGIGVAAPGPVDPDNRRNILSVNLGWQDVAFSDPLESAMGVPTIVDHNVRSMALAEARHGNTSGADPLLYVYVRTGVGAGIIIDGQPFRSGTHGVTELGHLQVVENGRRCACGATGCLETVVSEPYLADMLTPILGRITTNPLPDLLAAARTDPRAVAILDNLINYLAIGLANAVNLLNPELILLGGMLDDAPEAILDRIRDALQVRAFPVLRDTIRIGRSTLGSNAGIVGGAAVALNHLFYCS